MANNFVDMFLTQMRTTGYLKSNRFAIMFRLSQPVLTKTGIASSFSPYNLRLSMNCKSVTFPERSMNTHDRDIAGPIRKVPYTSTFGDGASFTFRLPADAKEIGVFDKWQNMITDPISRQVGYYNDYAKGNQLAILMLPNFIKNYDQVIAAADLRRLPGVVLNEIYPKIVQINDGSMTTDTLSEVTYKVTFGFRDMYLSNFNEMIHSGYIELQNISTDAALQNLGNIRREAFDNSRLVAKDGRVVAFFDEQSAELADDLNINTPYLDVLLNDAFEKPELRLNAQDGLLRQNLGINQAFSLAALIQNAF